MNTKLRLRTLYRHRVMTWPFELFAHCLSRRGLVAILLAVAPWPVLASINAADVGASVVIVNAYQGKTLVRSASGYVVHTGASADDIITGAGLVRGADTLTVQTPTDGKELAAKLVSSTSHDLALLKVDGLALRPLTFSKGLPQPGGTVWTGLKWSRASGNVGLVRGNLQESPAQSTQPAMNESGVLSHSASVGGQSAGSILLNDCGQVIGFNVSGPGATGDVKAIDGATLQSMLAGMNVPVTDAASACVSMAVAAGTQVAGANLAGDRVAHAQQASDSLQHQLQASNKRMDTLVDQMRIWLIGIGIVLFVFVVAFIVAVRRGNRRAPVREERAAAPPKETDGSDRTVLRSQELAEYVLDGRDEDGIRYLLRISGDRLINADGAIIGRNPLDSPYIINHADVSRKHARMKVMKNRVFIEDLSSTNGTSVNGQSIDDKGPVSVANGDQIIIGSVVMKLRVLGA